MVSISESHFIASNNDLKRFGRSRAQLIQGTITVAAWIAWQKHKKTF